MSTVARSTHAAAARMFRTGSFNIGFKADWTSAFST
jgi:hypothetical protein